MHSNSDGEISKPEPSKNQSDLLTDRASFIIYTVQSLFVCPICNDYLSNPSTLRCGHTICSRHNACTLHSPPVHSDRKVNTSLQKILQLVDRHSLRQGSDQDHIGRSAKRPRNDKNDDLVAFLRSESTRQRTPHHKDIVLPSEHSDSLEENLITEFNCEICFSLLYEPVTTPCQHVSCFLLPIRTSSDNIQRHSAYAASIVHWTIVPSVLSVGNSYPVSHISRIILATSSFCNSVCIDCYPLLGVY